MMDRLERGGYAREAAELRRGFGCLNGLTDGAALFLDSIERVEATAAARFTAQDREVFREIHKAIYRVVYR